MLTEIRVRNYCEASHLHIYFEFVPFANMEEVVYTSASHQGAIRHLGF